MKKIFFFSLLGLGLLSASVSHAQISFGAKAGAGASFLFADNINIRQSEPNLSQEILQGVLIGGVFRYIPPEKKSGILMEFNLAQKGWSELTDVGGTFTTRLNYLEVPMMAHIRIGRAKTKVGVNAGPYFSYLISFNETAAGGATEADASFRMTDDNRNRPGYGLSMGLSLTRNTAIGDFQLDFRYNLGLSNVVQRIDDTIPDFTQLQDVHVGISYIWPFGRKEKKPKKPKPAPQPVPEPAQSQGVEGR